MGSIKGFLNIASENCSSLPIHLPPAPYKTQLGQFLYIFFVKKEMDIAQKRAPNFVLAFTGENNPGDASQ